jgi:tetratricopeptide (TPR) repeat protein
MACASGACSKCFRSLLIQFAVAAAALLIAFAVSKGIALAEGRGEPRQSLEDQLKERDRQQRRVERFRALGKLDEALMAAQKMLAIERQAFVTPNHQIVGSLAIIAGIQENLDDLAGARQTLDEMRGLETKLYGSPTAADARLDLAALERIGHLDQSKRKQLAEANRCHYLAVLRNRQGLTREALELSQKALEATESILGKENLLYAEALNYLGIVNYRLHDNTQAQSYFAKTQEVMRRLGGEASASYATVLNNLADAYSALDDDTKAETLYRDVLQRCRRLYGPSDDDVAATQDRLASLLSQRGARLAKRGDVAGARRAFQEALSLQETLPPRLNWQAAETRDDLAELDRRAAMSAGDRARLAEADQLQEHAAGFHKQKKYSEALADLQKAAAARRAVLGDRSLSYGMTLNRLGNLHYALKEYDQAASVYRHSSDIVQAVLGAKHPTAITIRENLADTFWIQSDNVRCRELRVQAAEDRCQVLGERSMASIQALHTLAILSSTWRDYARAEIYYARVLDLRECVQGESHPDYAKCANEFANLHFNQGNYRRAEPFYRKAIDSYREAGQEKTTQYATMLANLAGVYRAQKEYTQAEPLYQQALEVTRNLVGEKDLDFATRLESLASVYYPMGRYAKAEPLLRQAIAVRKELVGPKHLSYASDLNQLANIYYSMLEYEKAEPLYLEALEIYKHDHDGRNEMTGTILNNLAQMALNKAEFVQAEKLYRQALEVRRQVVGPRHPDYATSLRGLAAFYETTGNYANAEPLERESSEIARRKGSDTPAYAESLDSLANLYKLMGDWAKAEVLYRQALEIYRQSRGEKHVDVANALIHLASIYQAQEQFDQAIPLAQKGVALERELLGASNPQYANSLH